MKQTYQIPLYKCDLFFNGDGKAYDADETDITEKFYDACSAMHSVGDYTAIIEWCIHNSVSCIKTRSEELMQPEMEMTRRYNEMSYHLITQNGFPYDGKTWGFVVRASGSFTYQDSTFQIASFGYPTISYEFDSLGAAFTGSVTGNTITGPYITDNRTKLPFTVTATHEVSVPLPGLDLITGTIGPFETESVFEIGVF